VSEKDDYAYDWDISDHDLQDKSDSKPAAKPKQDELFDKDNVVNFDMINKDQKSSPVNKPKEAVREPVTKIDFFGVEANDDQIDLD